MWLQFSLNQAGLTASLIVCSVLNSLQLFQVSILKHRILASPALRFATEHLLLQIYAIATPLPRILLYNPIQHETCKR